MRHKMTVLVDMDGVLVDLLPAWLHHYGQLSGEWLHLDNITAYEHEQFVEHKEQFWTVLEDGLETAGPTRGSSALRQLLNDPLSYGVYIVTYAHESAPFAHSTKLQWLKRYFPDFPQDRVIFTGHKHLVRGDVLIEDNPAKLEAWKAANPDGTAILIDQPYNEGYEDSDYRLQNFSEVPKALEDIREQLEKEEFYASK